MESLFSQSGSLFGLLGSMGLLVAGHVARKYVIPFLSLGNNSYTVR